MRVRDDFRNNIVSNAVALNLSVLHTLMKRGIITKKSFVLHCALYIVFLKHREIEKMGMRLGTWSLVIREPLI